MAVELEITNPIIATKQKELNYFNLPRIISYFKTRMYMGNGIHFYSKDKKLMKLWKEFIRTNDFYSFVFRCQRIKSETGAVIVSCDKTNNGIALINTSNPFYVGSVFHNVYAPNYAIIYQQLSLSNVPVICKAVYDTEKVVRTFWYENKPKEEMNGQTINGDKYVKYNDLDEIKKSLGDIDIGEWDEQKGAYIKYHNLGMCPIKIMYNKPYRAFIPEINVGTYYYSPYTTLTNQNIDGFNYQQVKDLANCDGKVQLLQKTYYDLEQSSEICKARLFLVANNAIDGNALVEKKQALKNGLSADDTLLSNADIYTSTAGNEIKATVIQAVNTLKDYYELVYNLHTDIFKSAGLDYLLQSSAQKNSVDSFLSVANNIEEMNYMKNYDTNDWKDFVILCFKAMGVDLDEKDNWSFEIRNNIAVDKSNAISNSILLFEHKLLSGVDFISQIDNLSLEQAELKFKEVKEWFNKNKDILEQQMPNSGNLPGVKIAKNNKDGGRKSGLDK